MINSLIQKALKNRFLTLILFFILTVLSGIALLRTPVDALPDLSENQVIVMTQWSGQSPQNIEDQITYPLSVSLQGLAGVKDVRGMSQLGISMVTVIFEDSVDVYFARDRVSERLNQIGDILPPGVTPVLGPDASGLGQIFMYTLESDTHDLTELRSIQDFTVRYELQSVPGVAEVASVGGYVKTFQVVVDPVKLEQYGVTLIRVMQTISSANNTVSGKVIDTSDNEVAIQGIGFFETSQDIQNVVLGKKADDSPLLVSDIGQVRISGKFRRSLLADGEEEKVGGVVVMRYGENPLNVIDAVKERIQAITSRLPEGVSIVPFYDRTSLIRSAIDTLKSVLTQELIITAVILSLFLYHFGATLITGIALLVGVLLTFLFMYLLGIPSNIMSLGGIAIAIGTMVDSAIVITENAYRKFLESKEDLRSLKKRTQLILKATLEVGNPVVFAILIIMLSFVPIFSLQGMEGKLFSPLAWTNIFAMLGALIASLFFVPLLATFFLKGKFRNDEHIPIVRYLQSIYLPLLNTALKFKKITIGLTLGLLVLAGVLFPFIGSEFMPALDEGSIMYMPIAMNPGVSEERMQEMLIRSNEILSDPEKFPEIEKVMGKAGRAQTATDPAPLSMIETFITLKPKSEWGQGVTKADIVRRIFREVKIEGLGNGVTQPIRGRIDMISTGIQGEVGIKVFGDDTARAAEIANKIKRALYELPGAVGIQLIPTMGLDYLNIQLDDEKLARYGVKKAEALKVIAAGVGGAEVSTTIQGRERYSVEVRLQQGYRQNIEDIRSLMLIGTGGQMVLLDQVASIRLNDGPSVIKSENGKLMGIVQMSVQGRDVVSLVEEGKKLLADRIDLPEGYSLEWAGQYENQMRANQRLMMVVPTVLFLIILLLYIVYRDITLVSLALFTIPVSLVGGIMALFFAGFNFSVAVWVGFIALFGNAVETGVVILVYLQQAYEKKLNSSLRRKMENIQYSEIQEAVIEGATLRLRPVLMTALTSIIGLLPLLVTTGVGSEVQKPLALVVVFGLITSVFMTMVVLPVLFLMVKGRGKKASLQSSQSSLLHHSQSKN